MKAVVYAEPGRVSVEDVPEPTIQERTDAIVAVRRSAICGSDLHLILGKTPGARPGAVIGHEFVGTIVEVGPGNRKHHKDTRVLGSFLIACGDCANCRAGRFNFCYERRALGLGTLTGDLDGAQAELVRVPNADVNLRALTGVLSGLSDEDALFGGDILSAAHHAVEVAGVQRDESVVVVGAGPVGLLSALAAKRAGAKSVAVLDSLAIRVEFAQSMGLDALQVDEDAGAGALSEESRGTSIDVVIEAVGSVRAFKTALRSVRDGGRVAVVGVYGRERYDLPLGVAWIRGLDIRFTGMANVQRHWDDALLGVAKGAIDPTALITHRLSLDEGEKGYALFAAREAMKVVFEV